MAVKEGRLRHQESLNVRMRNAFPNWLPVFGSHVKRIGLLRVFFGGFSMYTSIPFFLAYHIACLWFFSDLILCRALGIKRIRFKDHFVIDRYRIKGLPWFDRFNCMYCGYANGFATFLDAKLDQIGEWQGELTGWRKVLLVGGAIISLPVALVWQLQNKIVYDYLISPPLGMHRLSWRQAREQMPENPGAQYGDIGRLLFIQEVIWSLKLNNCLEQIETAWCPFRHYENRTGVVYPDHHRHFLDAHEIDKLKEVLQTDGTVSPRKPYW